ncbi:diguanylate cyclase [Deinococcus saxicola]|uniref:diguanylate cyclase n=1 Tax=Deinococcus saxicola TaxID=249406 RepID=UPI0039F03D4B
MSESSEQLSLLKRQAYLVALPVTLLMVLLTLALNIRRMPDSFNQVALPLLAATLLGLSAALYLRLVPLRWIEHGFYLIAAVSFLAKLGSLVLGFPLGTPDAQTAQVYIWAPFIYLLSSLIYTVRYALQRSLVVYGLSLAVGLYAVVSGGFQSLGNFARLVEFYLASGLWVAMLYILGTLKTHLAHMTTRLGEMERMAHRDALTGVGNRRHMEVRLTQQLEQFQRYGMVWAVILLDIDDFKRVNDLHGHELGDYVLQQVAQLLQYELRDTDHLARWGGEEFLIVAPQTDLFHAQALAERIRSLIGQSPFDEVGSITASFGVAAYRDGESILTLMQRADEALYRAKHAGKNRVEVAWLATDALLLPELYNPFPVQTPGLDPELCQEVSDWLQVSGLGPQDAHSRYAFAASFMGLAAALHPHASRVALRLTADWYSLMFLHDDRCDSSGVGKDPVRLQGLTERLLSIFQGSSPRPGDEPLAQALGDLRGRLLSYGGARWFRELNERVRDYLDSMLWEASNRASGTVPELEIYLLQRPITAGLKVDAAFIEVMDGVQLSTAVRDHPAVQRLAELADRAVCWSNDVLSLEKELQEGDMHNLFRC